MVTMFLHLNVLKYRKLDYVLCFMLYFSIKHKIIKLIQVVHIFFLKCFTHIYLESCWYLKRYFSQESSDYNSKLTKEIDCYSVTYTSMIEKKRFQEKRAE